MTHLSSQEDHLRYRRYSMLIQWSEEDDAYIVSVPELPGVMAHGSSYEEAARQGQDLIETVIDARSEGGRPIPQPQLFVFPADDGVTHLRAEAS